MTNVISRFVARHSFGLVLPGPAVRSIARQAASTSIDKTRAAAAGPWLSRQQPGPVPDFETPPVGGSPLQHDGVVTGSGRLWKPSAGHYSEGGLWGACGEIWACKEHCAGGWHNKDRLARRSHPKVRAVRNSNSWAVLSKTAFDTHVRSPDAILHLENPGPLCDVV